MKILLVILFLSVINTQAFRGGFRGGFGGFRGGFGRFGGLGFGGLGFGGLGFGGIGFPLPMPIPMPMPMPMPIGPMGMGPMGPMGPMGMGPMGPMGMGPMGMPFGKRSVENIEVLNSTLTNCTIDIKDMEIECEGYLFISFYINNEKKN
jgi:hypothetical protein